MIMIWAMLTFKPVPGAYTGMVANMAAAIFVVIFGFLFVTVSSRITGLIGTSSNPISGMAIATLMATCAVFLCSAGQLRLRRAGDHDRRCGLHRIGKCRQHFAGFEDRISGRRNAAQSADRIARRCCIPCWPSA